jgi:chemotaxis protein histidine kinase CheA
MERMRATFRAEALDLLAELDTALLTLEVEPGNAELVNRVFRAIHTIKGSGATAGFARLAKFSHGVEEAFDLAREGRLAVTTDLIDCGLNACDVIRAILDEEGEEGEAAGERAVTEALAHLLPHTETPPETLRQAAPVQPASESRTAYEIVFRPNRELFCSGTDPVTLLDELRGLGPAHITARTGQVPVFSSLDPECCYLWWEILLVTDRGESAIRDVFVFVEDDCEIGVRMLEDQSSAVALLGAVPAESLELFVLECEEHLSSVEGYALALERDPTSRESVDALFRCVHSIKGNAGLMLGELNSSTLDENHPLPLLTRVAHALESLLEPFRGGSQTLPRETVQTVLDARDAMRGLLESLARQSPPARLPASLLQRLQLKSDAAAAPAPADERTAAFLNTASQCVEMIGGCLHSIESDSAPTESVLQTYLRGRLLSKAHRFGRSRRCATEDPGSGDAGGRRDRPAGQGHIERSFPIRLLRRGPREGGKR